MSVTIHGRRSPCGSGLAARLAGALCVLALATPAASAAEGVKEKVPTVSFTLRLTLKAKAELARGDIKYALIPSGKHVGLSYTGVEDPKTVEHYTKLGFRTSIGVGPGTSAERIKELEDAGADLTLQGIIGPEMGLTPQEAYDGSAAIRLAVMRKSRGPVAVGPFNNMRNNFFLPTNRRIGNYLYAIHDSNFLGCNSWAEGYIAMVGRNRTPEMVVRPHNANRSGGAPNTLIYYQTMASILQGIVEMLSPGQVTTIGFRDFQKDDQKQVDQFVGQYGKDSRIWHTTQDEICGYAYLKEKSRIGDVKALGDTDLEVGLAIEQDTYIPFCTAPMTLQLPTDFPLKSARIGATDCPVTVTDNGVFVDLPVQKAFADGCTMSLDRPPTMSIPEDMPVTLTIKNTSNAPLENARLAWSDNVGMEVTGGTDETFTLAPGAERKVKATVRTIRGEQLGIHPKGARFGLTPISALVTGAAGGDPRLYVASWEIAVAPRLRVEIDPRGVPIPKDYEFPIFIHLANGKVDTDRAWGKFSAEKFVDYRIGPCKGTVGFNMPEGMEVVPSSQPFALPENGHLTLRFLVKNHQWGDERPVYVRPAIRFEGETDPIELPFYGVHVMRDKATEGEPLDAKGLLAHAAWDDRQNTHANLDLAVGSKIQSCPGAGGGGSTPFHEGVKNWCIGWSSNVAFDSFKNIDYRKGTVMFWIRRDPRVRNDIRVAPDPANTWKVPGSRQNYGEKLFCVGLNRDLILRRFPKEHEQEGYLELLLDDMPVRGRPTKSYYVQVPYATDKVFVWRHVAIVWDIKERRLELYLDGQFGGRADKGDDEWLILPWDTGRTTHDVVLPETHHGHWSGSMRDELYIYNRPLTELEIRQAMARDKQAGGAQAGGDEK